MAPPAPTSPRLARKPHDTSRALGIHASYVALRHDGKLPSNAQLAAFFDYCLLYGLDVDAKLYSGVSDEGRRVLRALRDLVQLEKEMLESKNGDEVFQKFLSRTRSVDVTKVDLSELQRAKLYGVEGTEDAVQVLVYVRQLASAVWSNGEARKLAKDGLLISRDVLADTAVYAAEVIRPSPKEMMLVDEPAPSHQWDAPSTPVRSNFKMGVTADKQSRSSMEGKSHEGKEMGPKEKEKPLLQRMREVVPGSVQESVKTKVTEIREYVASRLPSSRRQLFLFRIKKMIVENHSSESYHEAIEFLLSRLEHYNDLFLDLSSQSRDKNKGKISIEAIKLAQHDLQIILERMAGGRSMLPILNEVGKVYDDAIEDEELRKWFGSITVYLRRVLQEPHYLADDTYKLDFRRLLRAGDVFWHPQTGRYSTRKDSVLEALKHFMKGFVEDAENVRLGIVLSELVACLCKDKKGRWKINRVLWQDFKIVLPRLVENVGWIPIPRVEYLDEDYEIVLEDFAFDSDCLLDMELNVTTSTTLKLGRHTDEKSKRHRSVSVTFSNIRVDIQDLAFYFRKKKGLLKLTDSGVVNARILGKGIYGTITPTTPSESASRSTSQISAANPIDKLELSFQSTTHPLLLNPLKPFLVARIKSELSKALTSRARVAVGLFEEGWDKVLNAETWTDRLREGRKVLEVLLAGVKEDGGEKFVISVNQVPKLVKWTPKVPKEKGKEMEKGEEEEGWKSSAFDVFVKLK